jgi:quercetin dioxygenase-like cupin family protein
MDTTESPGRPEHRDRKLAPESAHLDLIREADTLRAQEAWSEHGQSAKTLFKYEDLRCVLMALRRGVRIREHQAEGRLSLQCLRGRLVVHMDGRAVSLEPGQLIALERCVPHDVEAVDESDVLITLAWAGHLD